MPPPADNLLLERQLCLALHKATVAVTACYRPLLDELGLTYSQYAVMLVLWQGEGATMGAMSDEVQRTVEEATRLDGAALASLRTQLDDLATRMRARPDADTP